jgi:hypothetical protein
MATVTGWFRNAGFLAGFIYGHKLIISTTKFILYHVPELLSPLFITFHSYAVASKRVQL